eukprot:CAMPEP_0119342946 /NCGR_PEP_ID=MMETSP1333-20130426/105821_1 /TAXON_ID=418940 /ORGANISM="Scyphosphaera apsteinii, Strain RCC1455" /LENGTH=199 /DNA_ID=CAMNT_0007355273 /DNA_START=13 /DNA_END=612 /DNA_ORIENTATION=+
MADDEIADTDMADVDELRATTRMWTSPTFACHRNPMTCTIACCCPCVQFGMNQRMAMQESCVKWTLLWLAPIMLLFLIFRAFAAEPNPSEIIVEIETVAMAAVKKAAPSAPPPMPLPSHSSAAIILMLSAMVITGIVGGIGRRRLRLRYGIAGSSLSDFVCHCCCHCCSLAKEAREIRTQAVQEVLNVADLTSEELEMA